MSRNDLKKLETTIRNIKEASFKTDNRLEEKINKIKDAFITNWKVENISFINNIINSIDINKGIPLPVLSICGKGTQEIRFTKYLAYFLSPNGKHGLQDKFLKALLNPECRQLGLASNWSENCEVIPEIKLGDIQGKGKTISCFGDIGIVGEDYIIVIEQKILSDESRHPDTELNQLQRYNIALDNNPKYSHRKQIKIYLTPEKVHEKDIHGWLAFTHSDIIDRGLKLLKSGNISKVGKENLLRLLIDLAAGPYESLENSLDEIIYLGNKLVSEEFNLERVFRFNRLVGENRQIIKILLEG